jgi:ADP-heptose:LPS heptosyltransferase
LAAVLKKCSLLIGIDSAPMHIAVAVGTPTVTIFGPSSPTNWAPQGKYIILLFIKISHAYHAGKKVATIVR